MSNRHLRYALRCVEVGARALGMLIVSAAIGVVATALSVPLLSIVIRRLGPLGLLFATLATIVGLAQFMHETQQFDEEAAEHVKPRPLRD